MRTRKFGDLIPWRKRSNVPVEIQERPLARFHDGIDRVFDRFFDDFFTDLEPFWERSGSLASLDMIEDGDDLVVAAEIPGVDPKDVHISLQGDELVISGEKKKQFQEKHANAVYSERSYGQFKRTVQLPEGVDGDKITASFDNGVIQIKIPRPERSLAESKRIPIQISS